MGILTPSSSQSCLISLWLAVTIPALTGCVTTPSRLGGADFDTSYSRADYAAAVSAAQRRGKFEQDGITSDNLLWSLQAASALQAAGRIDQALLVFDQTEEHFKMYDQESLFKKYLADNVAAILVNDKAVAYKGRVYDATMVNTYKALGFMAAGNWEYARVELNRASDRQRRAAEFFADELAAQREALEDKQEQNPEADLDAGVEKVNEKLASTYSTMSEWEAYPDFVNPLASYLRGVFLLTRGIDGSDLQKAADAFKEAYGMNPGNAVLAKDLELADDVAAGRRSLKDVGPYVWVLVENGLGPVKVQRRIDIPAILFAPDSNVAYVGIAYPELQFRDEAHAGFGIYDGAEHLASTRTVADIDRLVATEFKKRFPAVIVRAVVSAAVKTVAQAQLAKEHGDIGMLLGAVYQAGTTQADTRIWSSLPKEFQTARVRRPDSGVLTVVAADGSRVQVAVPDSRFSVVHVKSTQPGMGLSARVFAMDDRGGSRLAGGVTAH